MRAGHRLHRLRAERRLSVSVAAGRRLPVTFRPSNATAVVTATFAMAAQALTSAMFQAAMAAQALAPAIFQAAAAIATSTQAAAPFTIPI